MKPTKPFWASKTLWINAVSLVASVTGAFGLDIGLTPEAQTSIVGGVMAVVNIILRLVTKAGVRATGKETAP